MVSDVSYILKLNLVREKEAKKKEEKKNPETMIENYTD
jgi:hypothetical protein